PMGRPIPPPPRGGGCPAPAVDARHGARPQTQRSGGGRPAQPNLPQNPLLSFRGCSSSADALGFAPPDSMGAVGPTQFLFISNGYIRTFTKAGVLDGVL